MRILSTTLLVAMAAAPLNCLGKGSVPASLALRAPQPGSQYYPADVAAAGVQGTALIRVRVTEEGKFVEPAVEKSSKSSQLDDLAMALAMELGKTMKLKAEAGSSFPQSILIPVAFERDTVITLPDKTCAEFNADLAYVRSLAPAVGAGEVRAYKLATGMMMFMPGVSQQQLLAVASNLKTLPPLVEKACATSPDAMFLRTLTSAVPAQ